MLLQDIARLTRYQFNFPPAPWAHVTVSYSFAVAKVAGFSIPSMLTGVWARLGWVGLGWEWGFPVDADVSEPCHPRQTKSTRNIHALSTTPAATDGQRPA